MVAYWVQFPRRPKFPESADWNSCLSANEYSKIGRFDSGPRQDGRCSIKGDAG